MESDVVLVTFWAVVGPEGGEVFVVSDSGSSLVVSVAVCVVPWPVFVVCSCVVPSVTVCVVP